MKSHSILLLHGLMHGNESVDILILNLLIRVMFKPHLVNH
jgi:hypothetical protein